jgi:hypothetical protein
VHRSDQTGRIQRCILDSTIRQSVRYCASRERATHGTCKRRGHRRRWHPKVRLRIDGRLRLRDGHDHQYRRACEKGRIRRTDTAPAPTRDLSQRRAHEVGSLGVGVTSSSRGGGRRRDVRCARMGCSSCDGSSSLRGRSRLRSGSSSSSGGLTSLGVRFEVPCFMRLTPGLALRDRARRRG